MIPKAGKINTYTSGCPKNQKRCWNKIGSPPPEDKKNLVLKLRSINNIVIAPAKTGRLKSNKKIVTKILQIKRDKRSHLIFKGRLILIVTRKFKDLAIEEIPAKCREKITKSILKLLKPWSLDKGGYNVHPTLGPSLKEKNLISKNLILKGSNQKENLFNRGNLKSLIIKNNGISQLPKPPINIGITKKKIINKAWEVTIER